MTQSVEQSPAKRLTLKQERFARAYIVNGGNASAAYRDAYDAHDWLPHSVEVNASKLLNDAEVTLRVQQLEAEAAEAAGLTPAKVAATLARNMDESVRGHHRPQYAASNQAAQLGARLLQLPGFDRQGMSQQITIGTLAVQHWHQGGAEQWQGRRLKAVEPETETEAGYLVRATGDGEGDK